MDIDFSEINYAPFIIFIVLGLILVIAIEKIGGSAVGGGGSTHFGGGSGDNKDAAENLVQFVTNKASNASNAVRARRQREQAQHNLIRQIKISGLIAGLGLIAALSSLFSLLDIIGKEPEPFAIIIPASILIMGTVFTVAFSIRFFQLKRSYELYYGSIFGLGKSNTEFMKDMDVDAAAEYIAANHFDESKLVWTKNDAGDPCVKLGVEDWAQLTDIQLSMFYDDGEGYIDLGLDAYFDYDKNGNLLPVETSWLAINGQTVAYYHMDTVEDGSRFMITGYVPALLNGERVKLLLAFDTEHPDGYITGAVSDYQGEATDLEAKSLTGLTPGDKLEFICDKVREFFGK